MIIRFAHRAYGINLAQLIDYEATHDSGSGELHLILTMAGIGFLAPDEPIGPYIIPLTGQEAQMVLDFLQFHAYPLPLPKLLDEVPDDSQD